MAKNTLKGKPVCRPTRDAGIENGPERSRGHPVSENLRKIWDATPCCSAVPKTSGFASTKIPSDWARPTTARERRFQRRTSLASPPSGGVFRRSNEPNPPRIGQRLRPADLK